MTGVIRTNSSDRHSLGLHTHVTWPDFINPFVLLLLYYTLVALLHKWVHNLEKVCECVCVFMSGFKSRCYILYVMMVTGDFARISDTTTNTFYTTVPLFLHSPPTSTSGLSKVCDTLLQYRNKYKDSFFLLSKTSMCWHCWQHQVTSITTTVELGPYGTYSNHLTTKYYSKCHFMYDRLFLITAMQAC